MNTEELSKKAEETKTPAQEKTKRLTTETDDYIKAPSKFPIGESVGVFAYAYSVIFKHK